MRTRSEYLASLHSDLISVLTEYNRICKEVHENLKKNESSLPELEIKYQKAMMYISDIITYDILKIAESPKTRTSTIYSKHRNVSSKIKTLHLKRQWNKLTSRQGDSSINWIIKDTIAKRYEPIQLDAAFASFLQQPLLVSLCSI
jgi:hypothetical protein